MPGPGDDGVEDHGRAVDDRELVVAGGESAPLLDVAVATLDDVAVAVVGGIEPDGSAAACPATLAVPLLVGRLGDHGVDPAGA